MKKLSIVIALVAIVLSACGAPAPAPTAVPPTAVPPTDAPPTAVPPTATLEPCSDSTQVIFESINNSSEEMTFFWVNFDGKEESYGAAKPGERFNICTYEANKWVARNAKGEFVVEYTANTDATQRFDVTQEMADNAGQEPVVEFIEFDSPDGLVSVEVPGDWEYQEDNSTPNVMSYVFRSKDQSALVHYVTYDDGKTNWNQGDAGKFALEILNGGYTDGAGDIKISDDKIVDGIEYLTWNSSKSQFSGVTAFKANGTLVGLITFLYNDLAKDQYAQQMDYLISTLKFNKQEMADNAGQEPQETASAIEPLSGYIEVTDDTGGLKIQVPSDWTKHNGAVSNESLWQNIGLGTAEVTVSPNLDPLKEAKAPGVIATAVVSVMDTSDALDALKSSLKNCQSSDSLPPRQQLSEENIEGFVELVGCTNSVMFLSTARQKTGWDGLILIAFTAPLSEDPATMSDVFGKILSSVEVK